MHVWASAGWAIHAGHCVSMVDAYLCPVFVLKRAMPHKSCVFTIRKSRGMFAHELLHVLQRELGMAVTRQALLLQGTYFLAGRNPYLYRTSANARQMLRHFWAGNVEQQAQMWQDHVQAQVAGQSLPGHALLAQAVRHGRLRSRRPV